MNKYLGESVELLAARLAVIEVLSNEVCDALQSVVKVYKVTDVEKVIADLIAREEVLVHDRIRMTEALEAAKDAASTNERERAAETGKLQYAPPVAQGMKGMEF